LLITIITVCYNAEKTIRDTIDSVLNQTYKDIDYIIVDGGSTDGTLAIIQEYAGRLRYVSELDSGMYDAMNKGIAMASGLYVGLLNADDFFADQEVISKIVEGIKTTNSDVIFSQLDVVDDRNISRIFRKYRVSSYSKNMLRIGMMPAHPTMYLRRSCYQALGDTPYRTDYRIAADFELMLRLLMTQLVSYTFLPMVSIKMRAGGASNSSLGARIQLNREIIRACKANGLYTNWLVLLLKIPARLLELVR
jgi:glycosyltransferase involved in cell wall biosynthesis